MPIFSSDLQENLKLLETFAARTHRAMTLLEGTQNAQERALLCHTIFASYLSIRSIVPDRSAQEYLQTVRKAIKC